MSGVIVGLFFLLVGGLERCQADVNITEYIFWKKEDIHQWHKFFPSRYLEEEHQTIEAAVVAVSSMGSSLSSDLSRVVAFQYRELTIAMEMMGGTPAEGCVKGISNYLNQAIEEQVNTYQDCTADAQSKLTRLNTTLVQVNVTYQTAYQRALTGIDVCNKTYPDKGSFDRLRSCVESMNYNYVLAANNTHSSVVPSPAMSYFQITPAECASSAAKAVADKGAKFLDMLVNCANLSGTIDPTKYAEELKQWTGYNDTLNNQIVSCQSDNYYQVSVVESDMKNYYLLQKQALEKYVIQSRGLDFYLTKLYDYLADYYNAVTAASVDYPGEYGCVAAAKNSLDAVVNASAGISLYCDERVVNITRGLVVDIYEKFLFLNQRMPSVGNVAVLNCFSQGSIFAPDTIEKCFKLNYSYFEVDFSDTYGTVVKETSMLDDFMSSFYNTSELPCDDSTLKRTSLAGDKILFDLQRCLYNSSGTTYEVTTPSSLTTLLTTTTEATTVETTTFPFTTNTTRYTFTTASFTTESRPPDTTAPFTTTTPFLTTTERPPDTTIPPHYTTITSTTKGYTSTTSTTPDPPPTTTSRRTTYIPTTTRPTTTTTRPTTTTKRPRPTKRHCKRCKSQTSQPIY